MSETPDFQILSLSGGGARGLYTIAVLAGIEEHLAEVTNQKDYTIPFYICPRTSLISALFQVKSLSQAWV